MGGRPPNARDPWEIAAIIEDVEWMHATGAPPWEWPLRVGISAWGLYGVLVRNGQHDLARHISRYVYEGRT